MMNSFYIYIYLDPRKPGKYKYGSYEFNYEPFYVGKGKNRRWKQKKNDHCENKINKIKKSGIKLITMKLKENLEENYSLILEKELILLIGREKLNKGSLTNMADGGKSNSGYIWTEEQLHKQRKNFPKIKETFEKRNYKLLTEEKDYKNAHQKLEYICDKGHKHSVSWNNFKYKYNCPICSNNNKKKKFLDIQNEFEKRNYKLLTREIEYKNNKQKLNCICPSGHKYLITWHNFQQGRNCPCHRKGSVT